MFDVENRRFEAEKSVDDAFPIVADEENRATGFQKGVDIAADRYRVVEMLDRLEAGDKLTTLFDFYDEMK